MSSKTLRITNAATIATVAIVLALFALLAPPASAQDGAALFKAKCAGCHGADGSKAKMGANVIRPLNSADVQKQSDAELVTIASKGKGKMPAYEAKLKPEEIKAVVAYIRTLKK